VETTFAHYGAYHRVQPWAVAPAGEYAHFHCLLLIACNVVFRRHRGSAQPMKALDTLLL
jgi:hypothetical protein